MPLQSNALRDRTNGLQTPPPTSEADEEEITDGKRSDPKYKIQITLGQRQKNVLFNLREETGVESAAQVVRDALRVYQYPVEELSDGSKELSITDNDTGKVTTVKLI